MAACATDWAYLAGMLDGEGTLTLVRRGKKRGGYMVKVSIYGTDERLMTYLTETFGGSVARFDKRNPWKPMLTWSAVNIRELLIGAMPYLRLKKEQAVLLIRYIDTAIPAANGRKRGVPEGMIAIREDIRSALTALNGRGCNAVQIQ